MSTWTSPKYPVTGSGPTGKHGAAGAHDSPAATGHVLAPTTQPPTCARRPIQQHALGLRDAQRIKQLWVLQRQLDHLRQPGRHNFQWVSLQIEVTYNGQLLAGKRPRHQQQTKHSTAAPNKLTAAAATASGSMYNSSSSSIAA